MSRVWPVMHLVLPPLPRIDQLLQIDGHLIADAPRPEAYIMVCLLNSKIKFVSCNLRSSSLSQSLSLNTLETGWTHVMGAAWSQSQSPPSAAAAGAVVPHSAAVAAVGPHPADAVCAVSSIMRNLFSSADHMLLWFQSSMPPSSGPNTLYA